MHRLVRPKPLVVLRVLHQPHSILQTHLWLSVQFQSPYPTGTCHCLLGQRWLQLHALYLLSQSLDGGRGLVEQRGRRRLDVPAAPTRQPLDTQDVVGSTVPHVRMLTCPHVHSMIHHRVLSGRSVATIRAATKASSA